MKKLNNIFQSSSIIVLMIATSFSGTLTGCKEEVGCTTRTSDNYNPDAVREDGSCINARDKFLGIYDILHIRWDGNGAVRDSFPNYLDPAPRYMTIRVDNLREAEDDVIIENFGEDSLDVRALINKNFLTIPQQNLNTRTVPMTFTGEGHIDNNGWLTILYTTRVWPNGNIVCKDCVIFGQRQDN